MGSFEPNSNTFDSDLARANLLRVRGDFKKAEDLCLSILKTYPNSASIHTLLGDICADRGRLEQAAQWYELSLDLDPNSLSDQQKLDDVRQQIKERDHISSVQQLGLPEPRTAPWPFYIVGGAALLVFLILLGYGIKSGRLDDRGTPAVIRTPIKAVQANISPTLTGLDKGPIKPGMGTVDVRPPSTEPAQSTPGIKTDEQLKAEIMANSKYGDRLLTLYQDLPTKVTTLTFSSLSSGDERLVGADLAKTVFQATDDPQTVIVRAMRDKKVVYQGEAPRELYAETLSDDWRQNQPAEDAWIDHMMTNELWAKSPSDAATGTTSSTPVDSGPGEPGVKPGSPGPDANSAPTKSGPSTAGGQ